MYIGHDIGVNGADQLVFGMRKIARAGKPAALRFKTFPRDLMALFQGVAEERDDPFAKLGRGLTRGVERRDGRQPRLERSKPWILWTFNVTCPGALAACPIVYHMA